jgi:poly(3-hydroxybutyrate) depolymerase
MWNSLFWPCFAAVPKCVDKQLDDIGFVANLINNMQQQLLPGIPLKPKALLSGYSNGGMLAQALLCKQPNLASKLAGVSILASTLGEQFAGGSCKQQLPASLPFLWVHGTADDTLPYGHGMSEGIQMLGAGERSGRRISQRIHYAAG